ncbi:ATP-dependent nuclease [Streptococcus caprae]|uniref:ATP-dependent endonuclease n=1 Tax=Streptococcus caprae TaxID=1640501 RepID=A0ABV8CWF6_9STRE
MFISKITLENFKCFSGKTEIFLDSGMNFFVGDNNAGKTTIFKAIEFIKSGKIKEDWITKSLSDKDEVSVELELRGEDLSSLLETEKLKKYKPYLIDEEKIIIRRSSKETTWEDSKGKKKSITLKNITFYNPETKDFENPSGIDTVLSSLFETQFIYSDLKNEDYQGFGKTNIAGRLISDITEEFKKSKEWEELEKAHDNAFRAEGLTKLLSRVQNRVEAILNEQYGEASVEFNFGLPTLDNFFKNGNILLEENGIKTDISEKGTGMQRALALSLIQVYADIDQPSASDMKTPLFFFIDEPETFLHPQAQDKLLNSLEKISLNSQIFITTHSPYLLRNYDKLKHKLFIFSRQPHVDRIQEDCQIGILPYSPSWGEINYFAFKVASAEFHNELFGELHNLANTKNKTFDSGNKTVGKGITSFDGWLAERKGMLPTSDDYINKNPSGDYVDKTLSSYIRNYIDHPGDDESLPEGQKRNKPTIEDIKKSIEFLLSVYNTELK